MSSPLSSNQEYPRSNAAFEAAFHSFRGQGNVDFFTNPSNRMLETLNRSNDWISTADLFRAHLQRVTLLMLLFIYGLIYPLWGRFHDFHSTVITCLVVEWAQVEGILATLLFPIDAANRIGTLLSNITVETRNVIPRNKPATVGLVWRLNELTLELPTNSIEGCSKKFEQRCNAETNEYLTKMKVHYVAEEVRLLHELAIFCHWNHNAGIDTVLFHEEYGLLWGDHDLNKNSDLPSWVQRFKEALEVEILASPGLQRINHIQIIDLSALRTFRLQIAENSTDMEDIFTLYLSDSSALEKPVDENSLAVALANFPPCPELLLNFDCDKFATNFVTSKFVTGLKFKEDQSPPETNRSIVCYSDSKFSYRSYIKGLHYFARANRFKKEM